MSGTTALEEMREKLEDALENGEQWRKTALSHKEDKERILRENEQLHKRLAVVLRVAMGFEGER